MTVRGIGIDVEEAGFGNPPTPATTPRPMTRPQTTISRRFGLLRDADLTPAVDR